VSVPLTKRAPVSLFLISHSVDNRQDEPSEEHGCTKTQKKI
jgi:hypothetical protein